MSIGADVASAAGRRGRLRELLAQHDLDGLLVTDLANIRYLSGFSGSNAALFVSAIDSDDDVIATDARYTIQVSAEAPDLPVILDRASIGALVASLASHGITRLLVEDSMSMQAHDLIRATMRELRSTAGMVEGLRIVKDAHELASLERACMITAAAMVALFDEMQVGWTEIQAARRLEQLFGELGADDRAFETIVGSGEHSAIPHHQPTTRQFTEGDLVVVDAGARCDGYHADMTRTVIVGRGPADWQAEIHECVKEGQAAALDASVVGAELTTIDTAARGFIADAGFGEFFGHGLGHGVGLEIHEAPWVGPRGVGRLISSTPFTLEPGIYLPGRGGVRIEDTVVVEPGGVRVLTAAHRGLRVVG
ncbi:unannotated protein [freshwater metagenome]|uniref:Unannotated protein n=1 Tax=freshwater metagenome TaxID=449393 RepID=A0A6J7HHD0_9ZZZZ